MKAPASVSSQRLLLIAGLMVGMSALHAAPKPWFVDESTLPFAALPDATAYWGVHAGAGYRIEVPNQWNGDLVMYAHGFRGTNPQLTVSNPSIRAHLISRGYAWAASSYSANNYVPGIGAKDTHALVGRFNGIVGNATRVYIMGHSMGGHVTGVSVEQWPQTYAGALPMCGVMGDAELFDYFQDVYLVAETLVGNEPAVPTPEDYASVGSVATRSAMGPGYPVALNQTGIRFRETIENLTGGQRPTFDESFAVGPFGGNFIFGQAGTGSGRENLNTVYQFDADPALSPEEQDFNDSILRLAADPQFRRKEGLGPYPGSRAGVDAPPVNGNITIPVVTLHTLGELFVPFHMEQIYARRVAAQGNAGLLVSRAIRDVLHCGFTQEEQQRAFDDLVAWVETGVRPEGDDILNPGAVAAADFGCAFTEGFSAFRGFLPACP
jgi:hypothetical protein